MPVTTCCTRLDDPTLSSDPFYSKVTYLQEFEGAEFSTLKSKVGSRSLALVGNYLYPGNFPFGAAWTLEFWLCGTSTNNANARFITLGSNDNTNSFCMGFWAGELYGGCPAGGQRGINATVPYSDGLWHHYAVVTPGGTALRFYYDGLLKLSRSDFTPPSGKASQIYYGRDNYTGYPIFQGYIDHVRFTTAERYKTDFTPSDSPYPLHS
jgi:hypothetical protein